MNDRSRVTPGATVNVVLGELLRHAGAEGRDTLNPSEIARFVESFGAALAEGTPGGVDLRIELTNTREFGVVLSAGSGGVDGELDASVFGKDGLKVSASVELTDPADFLRLFRRTVAYRKMAAIAQRDERRPPDQVLEFCFGLMLGLGREFSAANPEAPYVLRSLRLVQRVAAGEDDIRTAEELLLQCDELWWGTRERGELVHAVINDGARRQLPGELERHGCVEPERVVGHALPFQELREQLGL